MNRGKDSKRNASSRKSRLKKLWKTLWSYIDAGKWLIFIVVSLEAWHAAQESAKSLPFPKDIHYLTKFMLPTLGVGAWFTARGIARLMEEMPVSRIWVTVACFITGALSMGGQYYVSQTHVLTNPAASLHSKPDGGFVAIEFAVIPLHMDSAFWEPIEKRGGLPFVRDNDFEWLSDHCEQYPAQQNLTKLLISLLLFLGILSLLAGGIFATSLRIMKVEKMDLWAVIRDLLFG